jgi:hypothetical protein
MARAPRAATSTDSGRVRLELSAAQIERVLSSRRDSPIMPALIARLGAVRARLARDRSPMSDARLSHSLLAGLLILAWMPSDGRYVANAEVARALGMTASTAHRYISTLVAVGLLERDPATRRYRVL